MATDVEKAPASTDGGEQDQQPHAKENPKFIYAAFSASAWIILVHELLERFSFYGTKGILTYYMHDYIGFDEDTTTIIYHLFTAISYLTPLIGTYLSDNFLGRYKTIVILGIIYLVGHLLMPLTALTNNVPGPLISLLILAIGTGGIKPCVAAFGGDQIEQGNDEVLDAFFSFFYMCINIGAFASQLITPILREQVKCIDGYCYPLGFGVPAIAFGLCYVLFLAGTPKYKMFPKPSSPMLNKAMKVIVSGQLRKREVPLVVGESKEIEDEETKADRAFVEDVRVALQVCFLFLPFPIYWALFDQQGSRWVLQGKRMDGYIAESFSLTADQMQSVNPLLIVLVVPIFNNIIYPLFGKCNVLKSATSRIFWGYLICSASFVVTGVLDVLVDNTVPVMLPAHQAQLRIFNANPCPIVVGHPTGAKTIGALAHERFDQEPWTILLANTSHGEFGHLLNVTRQCGDTRAQSVPLMLRPGSENLVVVGELGRISEALPVPASVSQSRMRLVHSDQRAAGLPVRFGPEPGRCIPSGNLTLQTGSSGSLLATPYCEIATRLDVSMYVDEVFKHSVELSVGAAIKYVTVYASFNSTDNTTRYHTIIDRELSPLHIALQLPQYLLMCTSEVLFSVTALAYAYSEAPQTLKALLQSAYLVSIFFGNMIVIAVAAAPKLPKQAHEFFLFAGLVFLGGFLQLIVIYYYQKMRARHNRVLPIEIPMESPATANGGDHGDDEKKASHQPSGEDQAEAPPSVVKDGDDNVAKANGGIDREASGAAKEDSDVVKADDDGNVGV